LSGGNLPFFGRSHRPLTYRRSSGIARHAEKITELLIELLGFSLTAAARLSWLTVRSCISMRLVSIQKAAGKQEKWDNSSLKVTLLQITQHNLSRKVRE
jgi:hypothetical protein